MTSQNLWDAVKAVLRGQSIAMQAYLRKQEKSQVNNVNLHLMELKNDKHSPKLVEGKTNHKD